MGKGVKRIWIKVLTIIIVATMVIGVMGCSSKPASVEDGSQSENAAQDAAQDTAEGAAQEAVQDAVQDAAQDAAQDTDGLLPETGAKLKLWDNDSDAGVADWAEAAAEKFTEKYGVEVTFESVSHTDAPGKLVTDGPAKLGADVFIVASDHLGELVEQGFIYPNDVSNPSDFMDAAVKACTVEEKLYGFPAAIETPSLVYNKALVKDPPKTFDELIKVGKQLLDKDNNQYGFLMEVWNFYYVYAFMGGSGGYVFGQDGTDPDDIGLNSQGSIDALNFYRSLKEIVPLQREDISYDIKTGLFTEGKLAFDFNGPWTIKSYKDAGIDVGVTTMPLLPNGEHPTTFSGVRTFCINTYTDYPNAARLLAQFLTSKEVLLNRYELTAQLPPRNDLVDDPIVKSDPINSAFLEQASYSQPMPTIPHMAAVWPNMETAITELWNNPNADVKTELDKAVKNIKDSDYYKK